MAIDRTLSASAHGKGTRLGAWSFRFALGALVVSAVGLTLARYDIVGKLAGFSTLLIGAAIAAVALVMALVSLFLGRGGRARSRGKTLAALVISLLFVGFIASRPLTSGKAPAIHDITTDLADPPQFATLSLPADNLRGVGTVENWRKIHAQAYGDLKPVTIARPVAAVTADAVRLAREAGWDVAASDPAKGRVEATASVSYIRFQDDIAIRIEPVEGGAASRVDVRSVSRVGIGDLGVNARRIRTFLKALANS